MTISRASSSRLDPATMPADNAGAGPSAPANTGQAAPPEVSAGLAPRQQPSFSFSVEGTANLPPRAVVPEITEMPRTSTPEHERGQLLRGGDRSDSSLGTVVPDGRGMHVHDLLGLSARRIASFVRGPARESAAAATRALGEAPTFVARTPPPERSWRSVASAIVQGAGQAAGLALKELALSARSVAPSMSTLSGFARMMPPAAGHVVHQAVAVGLPTFAREMLAAGVMHGLRDKPPELAMGLQAAVGTVNLAMQVVREVRERRNPDEAARAFHSLSPEAWNTMGPAEQAAMRNHAQKVSRAITVAQVAASVTNFSLMASAFSAGPENKAAALQPLATELKVGLYTNLRDAAQASFSMTGFDDRLDNTHGLAGNAFAAASATYAGALTVAQFATSAAMDKLVPGRGDAAAVLLGTSSAMSPGDAWRTTAAAAGVSAVSNTVVEATDWFQRMHFGLSQNAVPPPQVLEPHVTGQDLGRVLDQGQSRTALINGLNSALSLAGVAMTKAQVPPALQSVLGNVGLGAMVALTDSPITGNWQAQKAVRIAASAPVVDVEAGLRPAGAGAGARVDSSGEESGRLSGTVSGRHSSRPSFRVADLPPWPANRSGSNSPQDHSGVLSDEERRAAASAARTVPPGSTST